MAQEVDIFKGGQMPALDPEMEKFLETNSNMVSTIQVNSLSLKGKQWMITVDGETKPMMQRDKDGDEIPVSVFRGIILDWAPRRGRNWYKNPYNPAKPQLPDCWSDDGIQANPSALDIQHGGKCEGCPKSIKGSKQNEKSGTDSTACQQYRLICIVPLYQLGDFPPLRQKLSITADYDGKVGEHEKDGWFAYGNYTRYLRSKNVPHSARVITKIKFDPSVDHPKLLFAAAAFTTREQMEAIRPLIGREDVKALIAGAYTPIKDAPAIETTAPETEAADQDGDEQTTTTTEADAGDGGASVSDDGDGGTVIEGTATEVESDEDREIRELREKQAARKAAAEKPKETEEERETRELLERQAKRKAEAAAKAIAEAKAAAEAAAKAAAAKARPEESDEDREIRELLEKQAARKAAASGGVKPVTKVAAPTDDDGDNGAIIMPGAGKKTAAGATAKASTAGAKPPSVAKVTPPSSPVAGGKPGTKLDGLLQEWREGD